MSIQTNCQERLDDVQHMVDEIAKKLEEGKGRWSDLPADLRGKLSTQLQAISINCLTKEDGDCKSGIQGRVRDSQIYLCPGANEATLLHELVHAVGGEELDSEALENHLYPFKGSDPAGDDFDKFTGQDMPCKFMEGKRILFVSKFVIWDPKNGKIWVQAGSRGKPKKGKELKPEFKVDSSTYKELEKKTFPECGKEEPQKCGAECKDFEKYGYCDRKVYQPPCWQHRKGD